MRLLIKLDQHGRDIIFWCQESEETSPVFFQNDHYDLSNIGRPKEQELKQLLEVAEQDNWSFDGFDSLEFASKISSSFEQILATMPATFDKEPAFYCPKPLAAALGVSAQWIGVGLFWQPEHR